MKQTCALLLAGLSALPLAGQTAMPAKVFGYADFSAEAGIEARFLAVPDAELAGEHLRLLTSG